MGMLIYDALVLTRASQHLTKRERVLTLGVPKLNFSAAEYFEALPSAKSGGKGFTDYAGFFRLLGFETIDCLDISDYEGANILGDLNDPDLASKIAARYDLIYDSGTIEHVLDASAALRTVVRLVADNGIIAHTAPANGFMDHGFWQLSPDLFRTFYRSQGFAILTNAIFVLGRYPVAFSSAANFYRSRGRQYIIDNLPEALAIVAAQKTQQVQDATTLQDYYRRDDKAADQDAMAFFIPFGSPSLARMGRTPFRGFALRVLFKLKSLGGKIFSRPRPADAA